MNYDKLQFFSAKSVDALTGADTSLGTTDTRFGRFIVLGVIYQAKTITGAVTGDPILNVGYTSTAYADIVLAADISGAGLIVNSPISLTIVSGVTSVDAGTELKVQVRTAATGSSVFTFDIYVYGFYENL